MKAAETITAIMTTVAIRYLVFIVSPFHLDGLSIHPYKTLQKHATLKTNSPIRQDADGYEP